MGPPRRAGPKEASRRHVDSLPERAERGGAAQPNQQPLPVGKPRRDRRLQTPSHLRWKLPAEGPPARKEEFWNLRNDDFKEKRQSRPRPSPVGRTEGSEILFGIAPCSLALARAKRDFFKLFLKSGSTSTRPVMENFSRQAEARGIPVQLVPRKTPMNLGAVLRSAHLLGGRRDCDEPKEQLPPHARRQQSERWGHGSLGIVQHWPSPELSPDSRWVAMPTKQLNH
ncbi:UNVERIFIED_CONTAM: hypothetical protein K2H54_035718 [Gekko kuhli]